MFTFLCRDLSFRKKKWRDQRFDLNVFQADYQMMLWPFNYLIRREAQLEIRNFENLSTVIYQYCNSVSAKFSCFHKELQWYMKNQEV